MSAIETYAKEQETYYLEFFQNTLALHHAIEQANKRAYDHIQEGNYYNIERSFTPFKKDKTEGEGYYKNKLFERAYFGNVYEHFEKANNLFVSRIKNRFEEENGTFEVILPLKREFEKLTVPMSAEEVLDWLQKEYHGTNIHAYWHNRHEHYPFQQKGKTIQFNYGFSWDKDGCGDRVYAPSDYHELYGLMHFLEHGNTSYREAYADLTETVQYLMTVSTMKKPIELEFSSLFNSIRFYLNGRIDLQFAKEEEAEKFMQWIETNQ